MNAKKLVGLLGLSAAILLGACGVEADNAVVKVDEYELSQGELYELMRDAPMGNGMTYGESVVQQHILMELINKEYGDKLSEEDFQKELELITELYGGEEALKEVLDNQNLSRESYEKDLRASLLMDIAVKEANPVDEDALKEMYEEMIPLGTRVAHILVDDEKTAKNIIKQLNDGADFAELVEKHSTDEGSLHSEGQYTLVQGDFDPDFVEASLELKRDEITQKPVKSTFGYHVIKMVSEGVKGTYEKEREALEDEYYRGFFEMNMDEYERIMRELIEKHEDSITINDEAMADLVERLKAQPEEEEAPEWTQENEEDVEIIFESDDEEEFKEFMENEANNPEHAPDKSESENSEKEEAETEKESADAESSSEETTE